MQITLTPEMEKIVKEQMEGGSFASPREIVREALHLLKEKELVRQHGLQEIRKEVAIGLEQFERGEFKTYDSMDDFLDEIEAKTQEILRARKQSERAVR